MKSLSLRVTLPCVVVGMELASCTPNDGYSEAIIGVLYL